MRKAVLVALVSGGLAIGGTALASAGEVGGPDGRGGVNEQGGGPIDAGQAGNLATQQAGGGRLVRVQETKVGSQPAFQVTLVNDDGRQTVMVDAQTGQIVGGEQGGGFPGGEQDGDEQDGDERERDDRERDERERDDRERDERDRDDPERDQQGGEYTWTWDFGAERQGATPSK